MPDSPSTIERRLASLESQMIFQENETEHLDNKLIDITNVISNYMRNMRGTAAPRAMASPLPWQEKLRRNRNRKLRADAQVPARILRRSYDVSISPQDPRMETDVKASGTKRRYKKRAEYDKRNTGNKKRGKRAKRKTRKNRR